MIGVLLGQVDGAVASEIDRLVRYLLKRENVVREAFMPSAVRVADLDEEADDLPIAYQRLFVPMLFKDGGEHRFERLVVLVDLSALQRVIHGRSPL